MICIYFIILMYIKGMLSNDASDVKKVLDQFHCPSPLPNDHQSNMVRIGYILVDLALFLYHLTLFFIPSLLFFKKPCFACN